MTGQRSSLFGAAIFVVLRWFRHAFLDERCEPSADIEALWEWMCAFVDMELYDPMFDMGQGELDRSEQILAKLLGRMRNFVQKYGKKRISNKKFLKKSIEKIFEEAMSDQRGGEEGGFDEELAGWLKELLWGEFVELARSNEKFHKNFLESKRRPNKIENKINYYFCWPN